MNADHQECLSPDNISINQDPALFRKLHIKLVKDCYDATTYLHDEDERIIHAYRIYTLITRQQILTFQDVENILAPQAGVQYDAIAT